MQINTDETFYKWADGGMKIVAYVREGSGYSLQEYAGGPPRELARSPSLDEIQVAFAHYYLVKSQTEKGLPWRVAGHHLLICREAQDGKFEVRECNSFTGRIGRPLEKCETLEEAGESLSKHAEIANAMTDFNSLTERQKELD